MSRGGWRRRTAVVAAAVVILAAGGAGSCSPKTTQPDVDDGPRPTATPRPTQVRGSFERHSELDAADGMRPLSIEFVDAYTGYALLQVCDPRCLSELFVTFDGGYSWVRRTLPVDRELRLSMDVVDVRTLVLSTDPDGWYRSVDSGRSFVRGGPGEPGPAEVARGASVGCPTNGDCPGVVLVDGRPTAAQPVLPAVPRHAVRAADGRIYAVAANGSAVSTASSADGATWQVVGGPLTVPDTGIVQISVSADGKEVWLFTCCANSSAAVYALVDGGWKAVNPAVPVTSPMPMAVAAGDRALAVTGQRFGYLFGDDGRWSEAGRPGSATSVRILTDGTMMTVTAPGDVWLGTGSGAARLWSRITVDPV